MALLAASVSCFPRFSRRILSSSLNAIRPEDVLAQLNPRILARKFREIYRAALEYGSKSGNKKHNKGRS